MTARDRSLLLVLGAVVALTAFWFVALAPKRAEVKDLDASLTAVQQRLVTAQSTVAAGTQAKAAYGQNYATVVRLGKAVPGDDDLASLLYQIQSSAQGAKVAFGSLERGATDATAGATAGTTSTLPPGATVGTAGLATLPFSFTFTGSYFGLARLLSAVHGYVRSSGDAIAVRGRLLTVDGVSLTIGEGGLSRIRAKVSATAYLTPSTKSSDGSTGAAPATGAGESAPSSDSAAPPASATPSTPAAPSGSATPSPTSSAITGGAS